MCTFRRAGTAAFFLLCIVLCVVSGCAAPGSKPPLSRNAQAEALSCFSLGLLAEANGETEHALRHFRQAVRIDPFSETLYSPAVATALKLEKYPVARELADQLARYMPDDPDAGLLQAKTYALSDQPDDAELMFLDLLARHPEHPDVPVYTARFFVSTEQEKRAVHILEAALPSQPENAELLHLLGTLKIDSARTRPDDFRIAEGIEFLKKSLDLIPDDPVRWQQLGYALLAVEKPDEALEAFRRARTMMPGEIMLARHVLELTILSRPAEEAIRLYEQLAAETGTDPELWLEYLAEEFKEDGRAALMNHLESRIEQPPVPPAFYYAQLSSLYLDADRNEDAQAVLESALQFYEEDSRMRSVLGFLYAQKGDYTNAYAKLSEVRNRASGEDWSANPFFVYNYLVSAQKCGHLEEAVAAMALTYTNNPAVLNQYMHSLLAGNNPVSTDQAIKLLQIFHTRSPETAEALYYLMVLQADQQDYESALATASRFRELAEKGGSTNLLSGRFYYQYAALYERTGQLSKAEDLFYKAIDMSDGGLEATARNYIAYMWAERGQKLDTGLDLILKALEFDPDNPAFLDTLGWIYYMQGRYDDALAQLLLAKEGSAGDAVIWEHLGDTYLKMGNPEAARTHWEKALEIDPESERLQERLQNNAISPDAFPPPENSLSDTPLRP